MHAHYEAAIAAAMVRGGITPYARRILARLPVARRTALIDQIQVRLLLAVLPRKVCGWCHTVMHDGPTTQPVSHGMCGACSDRFLEHTA